MPAAEGGGIFVSYRRQDSSHLAGRLYDRLADRFGDGQVFMDVDTIQLGLDFVEEITRAVAACKVLVAVIGPAWLTSTDERGRRRLDDPRDFVRLEIEAALARGVRVIPILAQGAVMPDEHDLPEGLTGLTRRNALFIRHENFRSDAGRLVTAIERLLGVEPGATTVPSVPDADDVRSAEDAVSEMAQTRLRPGQEGPARAARVLSYAERVARSIPDKSWKVLALSDVAQAVVATSPDRAARLFADAERVAQSITDQYIQSGAMQGLAKAMAATDPDRAESIAQSIADQSTKDWTLEEVAAAAAATDSDRAESIARSIADELTRERALSGIAKAMAATDPDRAESIAQSTTDEYKRAFALSDVATAMAATDPDRAESIAQSIADQDTKERALSDVATAMAATDPDRAENIVQSITGQYKRALALRDVATAMAATDPDRAESIARSITDRSVKVLALCGIAEVVGSTFSA